MCVNLQHFVTERDIRSRPFLGSEKHVCASARACEHVVQRNHEQAPSVARMRTKGGRIFRRAGFLIYYTSCSRVSGFLRDSPWIPAISVKFFPGYFS